MANIKIMSLGGLGENGKNLTVVEVDKKIFILDAVCSDDPDLGSDCFSNHDRAGTAHHLVERQRR